MRRAALRHRPPDRSRTVPRSRAGRRGSRPSGPRRSGPEALGALASRGVGIERRRLGDPTRAAARRTVQHEHGEQHGVARGEAGGEADRRHRHQTPAHEAPLRVAVGEQEERRLEQEPHQQHCGEHPACRHPMGDAELRLDPGRAHAGDPRLELVEEGHHEQQEHAAPGAARAHEATSSTRRSVARSRLPPLRITATRHPASASRRTRAAASAAAPAPSARLCV